MSDPGTTYRTREEVQRMRSTQDPIRGLQKNIEEWGVATEQELKVLLLPFSLPMPVATYVPFFFLHSYLTKRLKLKSTLLLLKLKNPRSPVLKICGRISTTKVLNHLP